MKKTIPGEGCCSQQEVWHQAENKHKHPGSWSYHSTGENIFFFYKAKQNWHFKDFCCLYIHLFSLILLKWHCLKIKEESCSTFLTSRRRDMAPIALQNRGKSWMSYPQTLTDVPSALVTQLLMSLHLPLIICHLPLLSFRLLREGTQQ